MASKGDKVLKMYFLFNLPVEFYKLSEEGCILDNILVLDNF